MGDGRGNSKQANHSLVPTLFYTGLAWAKEDWGGQTYLRASSKSTIDLNSTRGFGVKQDFDGDKATQIVLEESKQVLTDKNTTWLLVPL